MSYANYLAHSAHCRYTECHILIDSMWCLAHADIATAAMARHKTWNTVAGLGYFWAITQLLDHYHPITAKDNNVVQPNGWHFIANIETTELRPDHRSVAMWIISMLYRKKPDTVSLPHCQFQCSWYLEDCWKGYQVTIQQETLLL